MNNTFFQSPRLRYDLFFKTIAWLGVFASLTALTTPPQSDYVQKHLHLAQEVNRLYGIPISICLAQGIAESAHGKSELATQANNHFGIKCKSHWTGMSYSMKDDDRDRNGNLIESCFRKYKSVEDSYVDYGDFLRYRERYQKLFDLNPLDYRSWAYGLHKYGYATNQQYAENLIAIITRYQLFRYDEEAVQSSFNTNQVFYDDNQGQINNNTASNGFVDIVFEQENGQIEDDYTGKALSPAGSVYPENQEEDWQVASPVYTNSIQTPRWNDTEKGTKFKPTKPKPQNTMGKKPIPLDDGSLR